MAEDRAITVEGFKGQMVPNKKRRHPAFRYALVASIGSAMSGYCAGVMSGAVLFIREDLNLSEEQQEVLIGSLFLVSIIGGLTAGVVADTIGRKKTLILGGVIVMIGSWIMGLAPSYLVLLLGRLLTGIGYGFPIAVVPVYIAEIAPAQTRGRLLSIPEIFLNSGILLGYISSFCLAPLPVFINWRLMLGLGGALGLLLACFALLIPESPRWLVMKERETEAFQILLRCIGDPREAEARLRTILIAADDHHTETHTDTGTGAHRESAHVIMTNREHVIADQKAVRGDPASVKAPLLQHHDHQLEDAWGELLWPQAEIRRALTVALGLQFFQQTSGISSILYYLPSIFQRADFHSKLGSLGATVTVGVVKTLFISVATFYLDKSGRRPLLFLSGLGMTISMAVMGTTFYLIDWMTSPQLGWSRNLPGVVALCSSCSFVAFFSMGWGPVTTLLPSEVFPLRLRAQGLSLTMATNRLLGGLMSLSFLSMMTLLTPAGAFYAFTGICALSLLFVYVNVPETKGKTLEEINH